MNYHTKLISLNWASRILCTLLIFCGFAGFCNLKAETAVWDGSMVRLSHGSGTSEDPYLIFTAEEMAYLIRNYDNNEGIYYRKYYKLMMDLDMRSTQWTFGQATSDRKSFRSHFDGNGHKISNIEVTLQDAQGECHYGLFPQLGGDGEFESVIENLEVENIHFVRSTGDKTGTYNWRIGGLVGQMYSRSRISNCLVRGFQVTDYGTEIGLHVNSRIAACPLVGEVMNYFGDTRTFFNDDHISIDHSYGHGFADLSHFNGRKDQIFTREVQGTHQKEGYTQNGFTWHNINELDCSFAITNVEVNPVVGVDNKYQYEGNFKKVKNHTYTYHWTVNGVRVGNNKTTRVTILPKPYTQHLGLTIYDNGTLAGSGGFLIDPDQYALTIETKKSGKKSSYIGSLTSVNSNPVQESEFDFEWQDLTDNNKVVSKTTTLSDPQQGHTYLLVATNHQNKAARLSCVKSFCDPIYVCNRGIAGDDIMKFCADRKPYHVGNDKNDGLTPYTAVRTLKRAYELLKSVNKGGTVANNVIVIMGDYNDHNWTEFLDNHCTRYNSDYFIKDKPALITGNYDNFKNGRMLFAGLSIKMGADTRFEALNLHGSSFEISDPTDQAKVFASGYDLTFGYGNYISGYKIMDYTLGLDEGVLAPTITVYGGVLNNNDPNYIPKENTVTIHSGNFGRVIAGDGYTLQMERTSNISGNPQHPVCTKVIVDTYNYYNPFHTQYDVALIIGGQGDGTIYADTKIEVKGVSKIGRIVGGNVAFGRLVQGRPADSFFGRTNVTVSGGSVNEIYGTNLGRFGHILYAAETEHDSCVTYFYGKTYLNLIGGTVYNTIYGGGAADVVGFCYDSAHYTFDPHVPYMKDNKIVFGTYHEALGNIPVIRLKDEEILDLSKTELHINIGGNAHIMGSVYGGSISFSSLLPTHQAGSQSGCIFADTYVNMDGGTVDGYIFGGCRSNLAYFDNSDHSNYPYINGVQHNKMFFSNMAIMHGNTHVSVTGGEVKGIIYGGGEGPYYRETSYDDHTNAVGMLGSIYGNTQVNIGGNAVIRDYIFGAGNYAHILRTGNESDLSQAGNVEINISGGKMYSAVFGAGHGNRDPKEDALSIIPRVTGNVHVNVTGGQFLYNEKKDRYLNRRVYGIACGGIATSTVRGDTYLNVEANPFPDALRRHEKVNAEEDLILCCGGYSNDCPVVGKTHLLLNSRNSSKLDRIYMGGIFGPVGSTECEVRSGNIESIYGTGRHNVIYSGIVDIVVGAKGDKYGLNDDINVDNIYSGYDMSKTTIIINGGNVLNVLRAE